jgi:hypothetical protein
MSQICETEEVAQRLAFWEGYSLKSLRENSARTADLSTTLRSGRDDKFVKRLEIRIATNLSSRPERTRLNCNFSAASKVVP